VSNGPEQPRKQQRSDLNVPLENNNVPETTKKVASFPSFVDVPGPCEPEDLIDGIIFAANYLGSTQLLSERNPSKNIRMMQAQEAVSRVKRVQKAAKIKKKATLYRMLEWRRVRSPEKGAAWGKVQLMVPGHRRRRWCVAAGMRGLSSGSILVSLRAINSSLE
ncbi:Amyloid-beta A4 precursor protein-binding A member 2, partial [Characodon lateralis]|nr:Amyloid-beta A4 precursor protein-binding A member 2 [Characodon lateralis]